MSAWPPPTAETLMAFALPAPTQLDRTAVEWWYNDGRAPTGDYHVAISETAALYEGGATVRRWRRRRDG